VVSNRWDMKAMNGVSNRHGVHYVRVGSCSRQAYGCSWARVANGVQGRLVATKPSRPTRSLRSANLIAKNSSQPVMSGFSTTVGPSIWVRVLPHFWSKATALA
jgi:hypothetical protein